MTVALFQASGKIPKVMEALKVVVNSGVSTLKTSFNTLLFIFGRPDDFLVFIFCSSLYTSTSLTSEISNCSVDKRLHSGIVDLSFSLLVSLFFSAMF